MTLAPPIPAANRRAATRWMVVAVFLVAVGIADAAAVLVAARDRATLPWPELGLSAGWLFAAGLGVGRAVVLRQRTFPPTGARRGP